MIVEVKEKNHIPFILAMAALLSLGLGSGLGLAAPVRLVEEGKSVCTIVTGKDNDTSRVYTMEHASIHNSLPAGVLVFAAHDLADHLNEIAGIWNPVYKVQVVEDIGQVRTKYRILLGTAAIEAYGLQAEAAALPYPAYIYRAVSNDLLIFGSLNKGTANGVYGFLQDKLGVRWFGPQELFRVVPKQATIEAGPLDEKVVPSFLGRKFHVDNRIEHPVYSWRRRMRMSESVDNNEPFINDSHNLYRIFPPTKYYEKHPEYYALRGGKRVKPPANTAWSICYSNTNVVEIATQAALNYFRSNKHYQSFSLGINDMMAYCECEQCAKLQPERSFQGQKVASDMYYHFVNEVARRVAKEFPDRYLGVIAYNDVTAPPQGAIEKNVYVGIVNDISEYFDKKHKQQDAELVKAWQAKGIPLSFHYYTGLAKLVPAYFPRLVAGELKDKHQRGFTSVTSEVAPGWPWTGPMAYLQARLWWDIDLDTDKLLDEYFKQLFGPAAEPMQKLYALFEEIHLRPRNGGFLYEHYKYLQFRPYTAADLARMKELLAAAHAAVAGLGLGYAGHDGREGQRVAYVSNGLKVFLDMLEGKALAERLAEDPGELDDIKVLDRLATIEQLTAILDRHTALYRETILADPYQSRRYLSDTCKSVRQEWKSNVSAVIGRALVALYRADQSSELDPRTSAKIAWIVKDYIGDSYCKAIFNIHAKLVTFGPNLVVNPGFENTGGEHQSYPPHLEWKATPAIHWAAWQYIRGMGRFGVTEAEYHKGRRSGYMEGIGNGCFITMAPNVKADDVYYVEAYIKNTAHTVQENKPELILDVHWLDRDNQWTRRDEWKNVATQELDLWVKLDNVVRIPEGAATAVILIHVTNLDAGMKVYVDEVAFRKIEYNSDALR